MMNNDNRATRTFGLFLAGALLSVPMAFGDEPAAADGSNSGSPSVQYTESTKPAQASDGGQPAQLDAKPWKFVIAPYLWIPAVHGTVGIGPLTGNLSLNVGDTWNALWDDFKFAGCLHLEAVHDKWSIFGDALYLNLGNNVGRTQINYDQKTGIFELGASYAVYDNALPGAPADSTVRFRFEPLAGARLWYNDSTLSDPRRSFGSSETWIDGFGGARCELAFNETFSLTARADIGTGMSTLTWNALAMFNVNLNHNIAVFAGWRWLSDDYSTGSGRDRFVYNVEFSGPFAGLKVTF